MSRYCSEPLYDPEPYEVVEGECDCGSVLVLVEGERVCLAEWIVVGPDESEVCDAAAE